MLFRMKALQIRVDQTAHACLVLLFFIFPISLALTNVLMLLTLLLWLMGLCLGSMRERLVWIWRNPITLPALSLAVMITLAATWSPAEGRETARFFQKYLKFLLLPVFVGLLAPPHIRRRCWQAFTLAMMLALLTTWLSIWFDPPWSRTANQGFGQNHTVLKDHISQGIMMSLLTCLAVFWAIRATTLRVRVLWALVAGISAYSILFLSSGRTGYLALLMSLLVFGLVAFGVGWKSVLGILALAALVLAGVIATSTQLQQRALQGWKEAQDRSIDNVTSVGARVAIGVFVLDKVSDHPVLGSGTAAYPVLAREHFTDPQWCSVVCPHPHNQFAFFLFEQGLIGLLLFLWLLFTVVRHAIHRPPPHRALILAFVAILVTSNMTHSSFWLSTESHFFVLMTALLMASAHQRRDGTLKKT